MILFFISFMTLHDCFELHFIFDMLLANIKFLIIIFTKNIHPYLMHSKAKHIPIKYHFLREQVTKNNAKLDYVFTKEKITNTFTKPLLSYPLSILDMNWK